MMENDRQDLCKINAISLHSPQSNQADLAHPQSVQAMPAMTSAETDQQLISLWLHGKSKQTQRYYKPDAEQFLAFVSKPLKSVKLEDLQSFADAVSQKDIVDGSKRRILSSIKSLISFAHKIGYLQFNVSSPLILPTPKDTLVERILFESEIHRIIEAEHHPRNKLILKMLYVSAVRVSELCSLCWKDIQERTEGCQLNVFGKGSKTRTILLTSTIWAELSAYRNGSSEDQPIFKSRKGGNLHPSQVWRIVSKAGMKAGITKPVCVHAFRHSHSSAALEHHCPIHILQATLGHSSIATTGKYLHARPTDGSARYLDEV